jgi:hypothetical protein
MNNFIVGQVTPDMLTGISYGTYILFGLLTYMGAAFIWWGVPETSRLGCKLFFLFSHEILEAPSIFLHMNKC